MIYKKNEKISIISIIATCNRPKFLIERSLRSVQNQTRKPNYIVVVDDSDSQFRLKNKRICLGIKSNHIFYLENCRNKGLSGAYNTALYELQKFDKVCFIALLDDDDEWRINYLEKCENLAIQEELDMIVAGITRYDDANKMGIDQSILRDFKTEHFLIGNPNIQCSNLFIKLNKIHDAGCFDEDLLSTTDRDLCIRLADLENIKIGFINEHLVKHYAFSGYPRLSDKGSFEKLQGLSVFFKKYENRMNINQKILFLKRAHELFGLDSIDNTDINDLIFDLKNQNHKTY